MKLSTRIALAVGFTVPVLVLAAGWVLLQLVARDLHAQQDAHLRERATLVAADARRLLRATAADRPAAVEQARERQLYASALDVGIRLTGPEGTVSGGPQPRTSVPLPDSAPRPVTIEEETTAGGSCRFACGDRDRASTERCGCSLPTPRARTNSPSYAGVW